jgi:ferric-dicitrate binding protein FerR (iron transport regulator)
MANFQFLINIEELIAKYLRGELSEQEHAALQEWIDDSPDNKATFEELTNPDRLGEKIRVLHAGRIGKERGWRRIEQRLEGRPVRLWFRLQWTKIAATVLLLILGMGVWFMLREGAPNNDQAQVAQKTTVPANDVTPGGFKAKLTLADGTAIVLDSAINGNLTNQGNIAVRNKSGVLSYSPSTGGGQGEAVLFNTLTTSNGQTYKAMLSDGSTVWLNSASSIRYPVSFTGSERKVEITGEVYFEVSKDVRKPFRVVGDKMEIEVLGTKFNVNAYRDETMIRTTLLEGSVKIVNRESSNVNKSVILRPGEQAVLGPNSQLATNNSPDIEEVLAWKEGKFIFNDLDLHAAMRQIERWYDVQVSYGYDPSKRPISVNGEISRYTNVSKVLDIMKSTGWLDFKIEGKKITILSK